jgi:glycosyltransferase involved in cell wall biosynthesis
LNSQSTKLKILLASWSPFIGGAEVAAERLALGLMGAGHQVSMIIGDYGEALERFKASGIPCRFVQNRFTSKLGWLKYQKSKKEIIEIIKHEKPDIIHSNDLTTHQLISDAAAKFDIPRICHHRWIFDGKAIDWFNKYGAERHLFVSKALMNELTAASDNLRNSSCSVLYDGLPLPAIPSAADRVAAKTELGLQEDKRMILFAGQIIERKGVADLLHSWTKLPDDTADSAELNIVGDDLEKQGAYRREMEALANELNVPAKFRGFQKNIERWLTAADIVVVPSHAEPLGNATLEAMAHARPVIGGDVGGIPEMIVHDETGLLVPPKSPDQLASAIVKLLETAGLAEQMGGKARTRCEDMFSLNRHVENALVEYRSLLT